MKIVHKNRATRCLLNVYLMTLSGGRIAQTEDLGFHSRQGQVTFLVSTTFRPALESTQPPIQWEPKVLSLWLNRTGREAAH
jgi:hypothetical protein